MQKDYRSINGNTYRERRELFCSFKNNIKHVNLYMCFFLLRADEILFSKILYADMEKGLNIGSQLFRTLDRLWIYFSGMHALCVHSHVSNVRVRACDSHRLHGPMIYMLIPRGRRIQVSQDYGKLSLSCINNSSIRAANTCQNKQLRANRKYRRKSHYAYRARKTVPF